MKEIVVIIGVLCIPYYAKAQNYQQVTRQEAALAAMNSISGTGARTHNLRNMNIVERNDDRGNTILYEVTFDSLSVLLSGSKSSYPLLGTYHTGNGSILANYDSLPNNIRVLIDNYYDQIEECFNNATDETQYYHEWNRLIENENRIQRNDNTVNPLLKSKWKQRGCNVGDEVGYEYYMPTFDSNYCYHASVGCGAVAMGQVLNYWKHPVSKIWVNKFDWCNMSDILDVHSTTFIENRNAISFLLKECAISIHTQIANCEQSYSSMDSILSTLISDLFQYQSNAVLKNKSDYETAEWIELLKSQLNNSLPIIYGCQGHTFVCDGYSYDNLGNFWISANFGWGGQGDGWYTIDNITYNGVDFSNHQSAIINIIPNNFIVLCSRDVHLEEYYVTIDSFIQQGLLNPWEIIPVTVTNLTSASESFPAIWRTIPAGNSSKYKAQRSVTLKPGFTVERGADFVARIEPCAYCESNNREETMAENPMVNVPDRITDEEYSYPTISASFDLGIDTLTVYSSKEFFSLTPNPTDGRVSVEVKSLELKDKSGEATITVCDATGREVLTRKASTPTTLLDLSELPAGTYFVTVTIGGQSGTRKLVVK